MTDPAEANPSTAPQAQVQQMQHITVTNRHLNIAPFAIDRDATNLEPMGQMEEGHRTTISLL